MTTKRVPEVIKVNGQVYRLVVGGTFIQNLEAMDNYIAELPEWGPVLHKKFREFVQKNLPKGILDGQVLESEVPKDKMELIGKNLAKFYELMTALHKTLNGAIHAFQEGTGTKLS